MTQQGIKKQPKGAAVKPMGETSNPSGEPLEVVLRELAAIKQSLALSQLPAIPLEAFLNMLRDDFNIDLPVRTAQAMIADGRIRRCRNFAPPTSRGSIWCAGVRWLKSHPTICIWHMKTPVTA